MGKIVDRHMNVFHIETVLNNRMYADSLSFLGKNEDDFTDFDRMKLAATRYTLSRLPRGAKRAFFHRIPGSLRAHRLLRRPDRAGPRRDPEALLRPVFGSGQGAVRHPALRRALHLALQREFDPEPASGPGHGSGVPVQSLPQQAGGPQGGDTHPRPPLPR